MPTEEALLELEEMAYSSISAEREAVALELFRHYLDHVPDNHRARLFYADCLRIIGRYEDAEYQFQRALFASTTTHYHELHAKLGMLYDDWGKRAEAEEHFAVACEPDNAPGWVWIIRGANLASSGRLEEALRCQHRATQIEYRCDRDEAFLNLGLVFRAQGKYDEAIDAFKAALAITPEYPAANEALKSMEGLAAALERATELLNE